MPELIVAKSEILRLYDTARTSLDPTAAVQHVAGVTGHDLVTVESAVQEREALGSAAEGALC